jgi:hypothetical protein
MAFRTNLQDNADMYPLSRILPILALLASFEAVAGITASVIPARPTPADTTELVVTDSVASCPYVVPGSIRQAQGTIYARVQRIGDCGFAPFLASTAVLGRLPAGDYRLVIYGEGGEGVPIDTRTFTVDYPMGMGTAMQASPSVNHGGHYLTQFPGEGVFIDQSGGRTFVSILTYGEAGAPTWYVMPSAQWGFNAAKGRYQFAGPVYAARRLGSGLAATLEVDPVGEAVWYPTGGGFGTQTAVLEMSVNGTALNRSLRRFQF